jgi:inner membrane protein
MYRRGHVGVGLAVYAPFGFALTALAGIEAGALGAVAVASTAMLPDLDVRVPFLTHRGITHTVWFALAVGGVLGAAGALLGLRRGLGTSLGAGAVGFGVGCLTVLAHLLADALTPAGIEPFAPLRDDRFSLDLFTAANPVANYLLLAVGGLVAALALVAGAAASA